MSCAGPGQFNNLCSSGIGDIYTIPDYCAENIAGPCLNISNEWLTSNYGKCPCDPSQYTITCQRQAFAGNPEICCQNDLDQYPTDISRCWSDQARKQTCAPEFRGPGRAGCRDLFYTNCVVNPTTQADYSKAWTQSGFCPNMIMKNTRLPDGSLNQAGLPWANQMMNDLLAKAFPNGFAKPGLSSTFQDQITRLCQQYPEACRDGLTRLCAGYTRTQLDGNLNAVKMCGCYLPAQEYAVYETLYAIPRTCDPFCANSQTVPLVNTQYQPQKCTSNVCLIDDITISLLESQGGNITFSQVCGGCGGTTACNCSISNISITAVDSVLGNISLEQECTAGLTCYSLNNGVSYEVPCTTPSPIEESPAPRFAFWFAVAFLVALFVIGLIILLVIVSRKKTPQVQQEILYKQFNPGS